MKQVTIHHIPLRIRKRTDIGKTSFQIEKDLEDENKNIFLIFGIEIMLIFILISVDKVFYKAFFFPFLLKNK